MKYLLRLSLAFVFVVGLLAAASLFLPGRYRVVRTVSIGAPPERVFPLVDDLTRWREWNVWLSRDPALRLRTSSVTAGPGAWIAWDSDRQNGGRAEILRRVPSELVEYRLTVDGMPVVSTASLRVVADAGGGRTAVTWVSEGQLGHSPATRWFGLMLGPLLGPDMERSLTGLRERCELRPQ